MQRTPMPPKRSQSTARKTSGRPNDLSGDSSQTPITSAENRRRRNSDELLTLHFDIQTLYWSSTEGLDLGRPTAHCRNVAHLYMLGWKPYADLYSVRLEGQPASGVYWRVMLQAAEKLQALESLRCAITEERKALARGNATAFQLT